MTALLAARSTLSRSSLRTSLVLRHRSTRLDPSSSSSLLGSVADFVVALRWKAATALTHSLNDSEREQLLRTYYQPNQTSKEGEQHHESATTPSSKNSHPPAVSIQEAVAAAVLKEQQRLNSVHDESMARAVAQAEQAAQARVKAELAIIQHRRQAFDAWQASVNQEKTSASTSTSSPTSSDVMLGEENQEVLLVQQAVAVQEAAVSPSRQQQQEQLRDDDHPILGRCLVDLGTKRIHLVSASALSSIPVWNQQRVYRHDRAKVMAADKLKTTHLGMLGVIALHQDYHTGSLSILDGQHRVGMMTLLEQKHGLQLDRVLVEVYTQQQENDNSDSDITTDRDQHAREIFEEINKAEPVKLVDMPGMIKAADRKTLNGGVERLYEKFTEMFSTSSRCRAPHVHMDNMRDALFAASVLERHQIKSAKALEEWMLQQNEVLKAKYEPLFSSSSSAATGAAAQTTNVSKQAFAKAHKHGFYLGLDMTWYHN